MEGIIKNEKHTETKAKYYLQEPALYFWYFYKNLCMASKYLVAELERTEGLLQKQKSKQKEALLALNPKVEGTKNLTKNLNKNDWVAVDDLEGATEDSRAMQEEDNTDMVFAKKSVKPWKDDEEELRKELRDAMESQVIKTNGRQIREALHAHAQDRGMGKFMSQPIFNN